MHRVRSMWRLSWLLAVLASLAVAAIPGGSPATQPALTALMEASPVEGSSTIKRGGALSTDEVVVEMVPDAPLKAARKLADGPTAAMAVAAPNGTRLSLPLPTLDGEVAEDFMEDMQEIESDMEMVERSAAKDIPAEVPDDVAVDGEAPPLDGPLPANHKARAFGSAQNTLSKQHGKIEMMTASLPIREQSITGRDKPLNVVFVFPRVANETRKKELEVMLVFPRDNSTGSTSAPDSGEDQARKQQRGEGLSEQASEHREVTVDAPVPNIYKRPANKYASIRTPPVRAIRSDIRRVHEDMEASGSEDVSWQRPPPSEERVVELQRDARIRPTTTTDSFRHLRRRPSGRRPSVVAGLASSTPTTPFHAEAPLVSGDDATIRAITTLQKQGGQDAASERTRLEKMTTIQSMFVGKLMAIQRELSERHAAMRRQMAARLAREDRDGIAVDFQTDLPAEHRGGGEQRSEARALVDQPVRKYRRPPAFRKPLPVERKEATKDKLSSKTLYKKSVPIKGPKDDVPVASSTTSTTTTTTSAPITTTALSDDEASTSTEQTLYTVTELDIQTASERVDEVDSTTETMSMSTEEQQDETTSAASATQPSAPLESTSPTAAVTVTGSPSAPSSAGLSPVEEHADQPSFLTSPQDRLAQLTGLLPEDEPGLASLGRGAAWGAAWGDERGEVRGSRSAFRPPAQLEGGFLPMVPGAPQIVGPIPRGYREVLRGEPVQLALPRPDRPADFHQPPPR